MVVTLDQKALPPIVGTWYAYSQRDLPYTTNDTTKKLIEGDPEQAKAVAKKWKKRSKKFPKSERDWRWLEFLVQATSDTDEAVGKEVDVLEIRRSGSTWLQNASCGAQ
jgi:hypothetical protein